MLLTRQESPCVAHHPHFTVCCKSKITSCTFHSSACSSHSLHAKCVFRDGLPSQERPRASTGCSLFRLRCLQHHRQAAGGMGMCTCVNGEGERLGVGHLLPSGTSRPSVRMCTRMRLAPCLAAPSTNCFSWSYREWTPSLHTHSGSVRRQICISASTRADQHVMVRAVCTTSKRVVALLSKLAG